MNTERCLPVWVWYYIHIEAKHTNQSEDKTMGYYDIKLKLHTDGKEKDVTNRVGAQTEKEAIYCGFEDEVHSLSDEELVEALDASYKENGYYSIEEGGLGYSLVSATKLEEVEVTINGKTAIALLPEPNQKTSHYFKIVA